MKLNMYSSGPFTFPVIQLTKAGLKLYIKHILEVFLLSADDKDIISHSHTHFVPGLYQHALKTYNEYPILKDFEKELKVTLYD